MSIVAKITIPYIANSEMGWIVLICWRLCNYNMDRFCSNSIFVFRLNRTEGAEVISL